MRLEEAVPNLPLGTVFASAVNGLRYVYIGRALNSVGLTYFFQPEVSRQTAGWCPSTYSHYEAALLHFPGLAKHKEPT